MSVKNISVAASVLAFMAFIIAFPAESLTAAADSVTLWFNRALPSLLPFMICINILSAVGFTEIAGKWLWRFMKLFGVPGDGGFALAAGICSGYPVGAKMTARLRENGALTRSEAQRLISFANNSGPLFILGYAGVGLFGGKHIGYFLLLTHYAAAFITGLLFSAYGAREDRPAAQKPPPHIETAENPLGAVLSQSVMNAMESMALIGGFIIFFGVLCKGVLLIPFMNRQAAGVISGILEMTNGLNLLRNSGLPLKTQILAAAGLISFGGFSIHAQTLSMISKTDIKASVYLLAKAVNAVTAIGVGLVLYPLFI